VFKVCVCLGCQGYARVWVGRCACDLSNGAKACVEGVCLGWGVCCVCLVWDVAVCVCCGVFAVCVCCVCLLCVFGLGCLLCVIQVSCEYLFASVQ